MRPFILLTAMAAMLSPVSLRGQQQAGNDSLTGRTTRAKPVAGPHQADADHALDRREIERILAETSEAWNRRDAKGLAAHSTDDVDHIGVTGDWISGKAALEAMFVRVVPRIRNTVTASVERIRFLSPDIAVAQIRRQYHQGDETKDAMGTSVFQKLNGKWLVTAFQNTYVQPAKGSQ